MKTNHMSRLMGVIWIITSISWAILGVLGLMYVLDWLENLQTGFDENLTLLVDSFDGIYGLVNESTDVISQTYQSLDTIQAATGDASVALSDMRPLVWKTKKIITEDIPVALDGVQDSMPSLIETAKSVDETLTWISEFQLVIPIPLTTDYVFDFGVDYAPEAPLDQALETMSGNLEGVPDDLRGMAENLDDTDANLLVVRDDLSQLSDDIESLNQQIVEINPQLEILAGNIQEIQQSFREMQESAPISFETARKIVIGVLSLLILTQLPSLYFGVLLLRGAYVSPKTDEA